MFSLICVWINAWVNNREASDLRRHRGHDGVTVMLCDIFHDLHLRISLWRLICYHKTNVSGVSATKNGSVCYHKTNVSGVSATKNVTYNQWHSSGAPKPNVRDYYNDYTSYRRPTPTPPFLPRHSTLQFLFLCLPLTHWGRVTHICVSKSTIIVSDNGLSPGRRQAIIWNNAGILLFWPLGTNLPEILIGMHTFSFKKMYSKSSSGK